MRLLKLALGAGIVVAVVVHVGTGAVADGLRAVSGGAVAAALGIGFLTTAAAAARWVVVARGVGLRLGFRGALADCYRAQFLNSVLPAGVLGDVHRAYDHGRRSGDVARGVRAVVIERVAGQVVVVLVCAAILLASPGPARELLDPRTALWAVAVVAAVALGLAPVPRVRTALSALRADARAGLGGRGGPAVVGLSVLATAGHLTLLVVAAGPVAPLGVLLPLLALALLAMGLPVNVGGWGPREATSAVAFAAAGLGAPAGLATAVTYGVLAFVSCLPGTVVLVFGRSVEQPAATPANPTGTGVRAPRPSLA
ncbi:lysylphosphatidylglycerol synthase domain-containing protein [Actinomycetospora atypica]|uniref:Lysylphosphatidylglycerol synthase domain-containing protein n=1 Tax=Actinomycetospora atypica TaxID=1290095 RepID=A0ABV9YLI2_9PSEU